ncbi:RNA-directed DNA polymerase [Streptomyces marispadix]|uniref:RNA-directed DNA polymerase n=1 Tax=Streptomyces marispadix TaxID=2922868 RepID=A0ABS9T260_9ACTN|nr:RNA-directed DNA polymerase [Streptomyces marispadix]MCH6162616.1 RNA-directed DNA polymerase [Streptomyces marispadix]
MGQSTQRSRFLDRAAGRLWVVEGRLDLPDVINFSDLKPFWADYRPEIQRYLADSHYLPDHIELVEHPKGYIATRPLARLSVQDRLIYETLAFEAADAINSMLSKSVFNHRSRRQSVHSVEDWKRMRKKARDFLTRDKNLLMARTDIVSFYEHIDTGVLAMDLTAAGVSDEVVGQLQSFLEGFERQCHTWGLPQGSAASGILANAYLLPVDNFIQQFDTQFLRYSDDIYIFDSNEERLRSILLQVNRAFRTRRLNMSAAKTTIFTRNAAERYLDDMQKDLIMYDLGLGKRSALEDLRHLFHSAVNETPANERDIKFSLPPLGRKNDDFAFPWAIDNLKSWHHLSPRLLRYLESLPGKRKDLQVTLEGILERVPTIDYPFLERNLFETATRCGLLSETIRANAWMVLRDRNRSSYPREFAARYIGRLGTPNDGQLLKMEYEGESHIDVRRALLVAMYEADYMPTGLLKSLQNSSTMLKWTAKYLHRQPEIPFPKF